MTRREVERRKFRQALVPGLVLSAVAHLALLGLGAFEIPGRESTTPDREREARAEEWQEKTLELVTVRPDPERAAGSRDAGAASADRASEAAGTAGPATVRVPPAPSVAADPVDVPTVAIAVRTGETRETDERLSASDLATLFPGRSETPKPASRAAREASGEPRSIGDDFRGVRGTRRAGARGGGCIVRPGTAINRRFPEGITIGG